MTQTLRLFLATTLCLLALPAAAQAALSAADASNLLLAWITATTPGQSGQHCLTPASSTLRNGGYTIVVDAGGCPGLAARPNSRWRIDAFTAEVFEENDQGKFVVPAAAQKSGPLGNVAFLAGRTDLLPPGARIIEYAALGPSAPERAYVLWMLDPKRNEHAKGEVYTCPDQSRGSYWSGPTRLSLLDTQQGVLRNTLPIADPREEGDSFDLPYRIPAARPFPYFVPQTAGKDQEGRPALLALRDLTGDGKDQEFYLASAGNCMLMLYSVFGYDPAKDQAVQYAVALTSTEAGKETVATTSWLNFWPVQKDAAKGRSQWEVDLRGRAGCLERYAIAYDPAQSRFAGRLTASDCQE